MPSIIIPVHQPFNFRECLLYLNRSMDEVTHWIQGQSILKAIFLDGQLEVVKIRKVPDGISCSWSNELTSLQESQLTSFISDWLDLDGPLNAFYSALKTDPVIGPLINRYHGLRLVKVPDLYEALCWTIIGQQVNLRFAYQVRKALITETGLAKPHGDFTLYTFPWPEQVNLITDQQLRQMQFSRQKIRYLREVTERMLTGVLDKNQLLQLHPEEAYQQLLQIKGIGPWSAAYVRMRCLSHRDAFPAADAGLHNALKRVLGLAKKPTTTEVIRLAERWKGWRAYCTFYLWRVLR